ncbi:MAG: DUF4230 domain-containing protein [Bacteroidota bacterium]
MQFFMIAPATIFGYVDFSDLKFDILQDSIIAVLEPRPRTSRVDININTTREYKLKRNQLAVESPNGKSYQEAFDAIQEALLKAEKDVKTRADSNGIRQETIARAKTFLRNTIVPLGYTVRFESADERDRRINGPNIGDRIQNLVDSAGAKISAGASRLLNANPNR